MPRGQLKKKKRSFSFVVVVAANFLGVAFFVGRVDEKKKRCSRQLLPDGDGTTHSHLIASRSGPEQAFSVGISFK